MFSGYYRVNYDKKYWMHLFDYLKTNNNINTIHKINCAALIDDLMNLARADYIDYKTVISALMYLKQERDYIPWRAFYNNLPYLNNRFRGRSIEDIYKVRILHGKGERENYTKRINRFILIDLYSRHSTQIYY